jgi:hypothetical protein
MVISDAQTEIFIEWNALRCPCCGGCLRRKTHDAKVRRKKPNLKFGA